MREIKFRGKRVDNGEWAYGFFSRINGEPIILSPMDSYKYYRKFFVDVPFKQVIPETVGQYTGLKDKNGQEIYEGDIVVAWSVGHRAVGEVKKRIDGLWIMYPAYQKGKMWGLCPNPKGETSVEIIGNIHENPELLEVD